MRRGRGSTAPARGRSCALLAVHRVADGGLELLPPLLFLHPFFHRLAPEGLPSCVDLPNIRGMPDSDTQPIWRFRLMILTALAVLVLSVLWLRARAATTSVEKRRSALMGSLRSLVAAQDANQARTGRYATTLDSLGGWNRPAELVLTFTPHDATTWSATVHDTSLTIAPTTCGVFVGRPDASPHRAVVNPGTPTCW